MSPLISTASLLGVVSSTARMEAGLGRLRERSSADVLTPGSNKLNHPLLIPWRLFVEIREKLTQKRRIVRPLAASEPSILWRLVPGAVCMSISASSCHLFFSEHSGTGTYRVTSLGGGGLSGAGYAELKTGLG